MEGRFSFMAKFFFDWCEVRVGFEPVTGLLDDDDIEVDFNAEKDDDVDADDGIR